MRTHRSFRVVYTRNGRWWVAQVRDAPAAITQGRTIAEARRRVREVLGLAIGSNARAHRAALLDDVRLPHQVRQALNAVSESRARLVREKLRLSRATDAAVFQLVERMRLSLRDAAELLGVSHQRVQQLRQ